MTPTTSAGIDFSALPCDVENIPWPPNQQPQWQCEQVAETVRDLLSQMPPMVTSGAVDSLRARLAAVAQGRGAILQFGECAEDPGVDAASTVRARLDFGARLSAAAREAGLSRPTTLVGRIAGQYAKPRSVPTELVGTEVLPAYRGHMVNRPAPDGRAHNAWHMLDCFGAAQQKMAHLGWFGASSTAHRHPDSLWTSHEALVLDYEMPLVRPSRSGTYLSSTHWPWIGERTRDVDGPHVGFLATLANPVAVKIGGRATPAEVLDLCRMLDPQRVPGRLTFIVRMGADEVDSTLPHLLEAVHQHGHPAIWMSDPMHGNTHKLPDGSKTRYLDEMSREVEAFVDVVAGSGAWPAGLHLEATPEPVLECQASSKSRIPGIRTSLCDPRLNAEQTLELVTTWAGLMASLGTAGSVETRTAS